VARKSQNWKSQLFYSSANFSSEPIINKMNCDIWNLFSILIQLLVSGISLGLLMRWLTSQATFRTPEAQMAYLLFGHFEADFFGHHRPLPQPGLLVLPAQRKELQ